MTKNEACNRERESEIEKFGGETQGRTDEIRKKVAKQERLEWMKKNFTDFKKDSQGE